ncbi:MAG: hypothetical protein JKY48_08830 [Flavobacteriales bacterium]|nr:hypothetical protein [Flavobacteriales bacterium]
MKKILIAALSLIAFGMNAKNLTKTGAEANSIIEGAIELRINEGNRIPSFVLFSEDSGIFENELFPFLKEELEIESEFGFTLKNTVTDELGYTYVE